MTIARIWRGWATPGNAPLYEHHFNASVRPHLKALAGFQGCQLLRRLLPNGEVELVTTTYWESLSNIHAFAGADISRAVVEPAAQAVLLRYQEDVEHYTVLVGG